MQVFKLGRYDLDDVNRLIEIAKRNDLAALEIESKEGGRIRIETKGNGQVQATYPAGMPAVQPVCAPPVQMIDSAPIQQPAVQVAKAEKSETTVTETLKEDTAASTKTIDAPMIGVFYQAPSPDSEPYVKVGSRISKGDIICIIEAMKLMNEIKAEEDGVITKVLVKNGAIVEYDQPMFEIKQ